MDFLLTSITSGLLFRPDCSVQQIAEEGMEDEAMPVTILFQADGILKGRNNNTCEFQLGSHSQDGEVA